MIAIIQSKNHKTIGNQAIDGSVNMTRYFFPALWNTIHKAVNKNPCSSLRDKNKKGGRNSKYTKNEYFRKGGRI